MSFTSQSSGAGPNSAATASTLGYGFGVAIPAGTLVIVAIGANVASLTFTCADNSSQAGAANVWNQVGPVAAAVMTGTLFWCQLTRALLSTDTITITASGSWTRAAGLGSSWTPSNANVSVDKTANAQNATTSPVTTGSSGTLSRSDDLGVCYSFWKGGAVASGHSGSGTIGGSSTASLSGGTTTRVECISQENGNLGATTAITGGQTYTTITAGCAQLVAFQDPPWRRNSRVVRRTWAGR